jgi:hypothetical protein
MHAMMEARLKLLLFNAVMGNGLAFYCRVVITMFKANNINLVKKAPTPKLRRPNDPTLCKMPELNDGYTVSNLKGWKTLDKSVNFPHGSLLLVSYVNNFKKQLF